MIVVRDTLKALIRRYLWPRAKRETHERAERIANAHAEHQGPIHVVDWSSANPQRLGGLKDRIEQYRAAQERGDIAISKGGGERSGRKRLLAPPTAADLDRSARPKSNVGKGYTFELGPLVGDPLGDAARKRAELAPKVFPAVKLTERSRGYDSQTGSTTDWKQTGSFFEVEQSAHDYIERKTGQTPFFLMNLTQDPNAWAAVYFTKTIDQSDEVLKVRDELRVEIAFASYGPVHAGMRNPPLGAMVINRPEDLAVAATRHEVFYKAWLALMNCTSDRSWVAVVDL